MYMITKKNKETKYAHGKPRANSMWQKMVTTTSCDLCSFQWKYANMLALVVGNLGGAMAML